MKPLPSLPTTNSIPSSIDTLPLRHSQYAQLNMIFVFPRLFSDHRIWNDIWEFSKDRNPVRKYHGYTHTVHLAYRLLYVPDIPVHLQPTQYSRVQQILIRFPSLCRGSTKVIEPWTPITHPRLLIISSLIDYDDLPEWTIHMISVFGSKRVRRNYQWRGAPSE
ncbi:hypothetical protein FRC02_007032 [Tulasnella sp. 418]|nr:hypothetical protein FRC02_007032 [Tulasnella sp. 418]